MKKRIISLTLALILLVGVLVVPVNAASAKDVHNYLVEFAKSGEYDSENQCWFMEIPINSDLDFGVYYLEQSKYIETSIYTNNFEVTWRISSNPSPAYNAYILVYDEQGTKGGVALNANYNGSAFSTFKTFSGNTAIKSDMLSVLNELLPAVLEVTRLLINDNDYTLKDLGMTGYKACKYFHAFDKGQVTKWPTCVDPGTRTYTCRVCGVTEDLEIPATGEHSWDQGTVIQEPSCTETGTKRFTCSSCGTTRDETVAALGHAWECTETLTPTVEREHGTALYTCKRCGETKEDKLCAGMIFTDMPKEKNWAHFPIDWAYFNGITNGFTATTFAPNNSCTRGEVMTFLWRVAGKPKPTSTTNPFTDVKSGKFYYKPVLWAVENNYTNGTSATTFEPGKVCNRAEVVTFLWKIAGKPAPKTTENPFEDVKPGKYYYKAVLWAVENGITKGTSDNTFSPLDNCTRAQVVTLLYNASKITPADPEPTEPDPTEPDPTEPTPSEPEPSEPAPTEPTPSEPEPSEPAPSEP